MNNAPIVEVVCGFVFEPTGLSILDFGVYAHQRADEFSQRQLHPAVLDDPTTPFQPFEPRVWLHGTDGTRILQLQSDRLYVNWRKPDRAHAYPRFDRSSGVGVKATALNELDQLKSFVDSCGLKLVPKRLILTKVNVFEEGHEYDTAAQLSVLLPMVPVQASASFHFRWIETTAEATITTLLHSTRPNSIRMDVTYARNVDDDTNLTSSLDHANDAVNELFFRVVNTTELESRCMS